VLSNYHKKYVDAVYLNIKMYDHIWIL